MITSNQDSPADVTPTEMIVDQNVPADPMLIDTGDFDIFSSLDDVVVEEATTKPEEVKKDDVVEDDKATEEVEESEDDSFDFEDIDDAEQDENGHDVEDEENEETDEDSEEEDGEEVEETEEVADGDEEQEVDFDDYMVTLPDGEELSLSSAVKGYKSAKALEAEREEFEAHKESFAKETESVSKKLKIAQLEADRVIQDYKDFDWAKLAKEDPQAYVENKEFLERYIQRKKEIVAAIDEQEQTKIEAEKEEHMLRAKSAVATLQKEIPGWSQKLYGDLIDYAVSTGVPESEILKSTDPTVFILLNKARQFDNGKRVVKAKIKRQPSKSPKKVVKPQAKQVKAPQDNKVKLTKMMDSGDVSSAELFANLVD